MEARRLALLYSHLCPSRSAPLPPLSILSPSACAPQRNDCVFCLIIRGESPACKLYEDDMCLCILDTRPLSCGHSLIIPKSHFSSLDTTPPSVVAAMCSKVPFLGNAIMKATGSDSFNLLVNNGAAAGQVIFHTHIHIIPRKAGDCLWTSESLYRRPLKIDPETSDLTNRVRELLLNVSEERKDQVSTLS
ncbi:putative heat shock protein 70 (HSP70)-interacting protein [Hibiscus syriacus]|uniref:Heat shock protein 70 (HSP70)-interacting protein n=1 Tax=Hibiscus syriacus TaxID=106335 RepID=A0A6A3A5F7_HIBSY|nr:adenylylsulfatase HINT3-like isoform X1 [Hibiscus syriacus]KAE8699561.1 putative heat shock protein 70 (HSP70)-interacting protein [Hibiscus syriacus]